MLKDIVLVYKVYCTLNHYTSSFKHSFVRKNRKMKQLYQKVYTVTPQEQPKNKCQKDVVGIVALFHADGRCLGRSRTRALPSAMPRPPSSPPSPRAQRAAPAWWTSSRKAAPRCTPTLPPTSSSSPTASSSGAHPHSANAGLRSGYFFANSVLRPEMIKPPATTFPSCQNLHI